AQSRYAISPVALDGHASFQIKAKFGKELNRGVEVLHHDADIIHPLNGHRGSFLLAAKRRMAGVRSGKWWRLRTDRGLTGCPHALKRKGQYQGSGRRRQ